MKPSKKKQPDRPTAASVFGVKPYQDQVSYIDAVKACRGANDDEVIRAMVDYFIHSTNTAADFWPTVNAWKTQPADMVNLPKSVTPEVNVLAEIASPGETFAAASLFLREIVDCGREQEASVVNVDTAPPFPVVNRTAVGLWAVAVLGVFCTLTFFAGRLTSPLILQSEASNRVNAQLREELKMAQGDATMARQEMTIAQKRAHGLETVMLKSWSSLPPTDQELLEMARSNQQVASARLAKINVNAPPEGGR